MSRPRIPSVRVDSDGTAHVRDGACRECAQCAAGLAAWCEDWRPARSPWTRLGPTPADATTLATVLACLDLVRTADAWADTVVILGASAATADLLARCGVTRTLAAAENPEGMARVRAALSGTGTGRADLIVTIGGRLDLAAKWVRRGGHVAGVTAAAVMPAIDTLVMREVDVLALRDAASGIDTLQSALAGR